MFRKRRSAALLTIAVAAWSMAGSSLAAQPASTGLVESPPPGSPSGTPGAPGAAPGFAGVDRPPALMEDVVLPQLRFDDVALPDAISFLRDTTGMNIVLLSPPGVDLSTIQVSLQLKDASLRQTLELLMQIPGVPISVRWPEAVPAGKPIIVITVLSSPAQPAFGGAPGGVGEPPAGETAVLSLAGAFPPRTDAEATKALTQQVTSLIEASLSAAKLDKPEPGVYFHPETRILLVRGTAEQRQVLTRLVDRLIESEAHRAKAALAERQASNADELDRLVRLVREGEGAVQRMEHMREQAEARVQQAVSEMRQMQNRIDALREELAAERAKRLPSTPSTAPAAR